ncbi:hypothetical protein [Terrimonas sp.]|uniref:hypothetical protein n=1 Tax=Terrimonas sp. TaxID=1914338 RepID=UPI0010570C83|nr:hypothetical protein [Terrimonas sp.]
MSIDNQIAVGSLSNIEITLINHDDIKESIEVSYYPGNLSISDSGYKKLLSADIKYMLLTFNYFENCKSGQKKYNYEIEVKKSWLENHFTVLNIYNTNKRQYKNVYMPLPSKNYTYEVIYPGGSVRRVTKKMLSNDCN